ncbi:FimV family protein [Pseudomonas sp. Milli4]|uniref:FimV family protein n=2 Tax=Pseudomonas schmalbachii TaxID=2816993 RepID=A0ABS3TL93_9PSED|nr:FimV family protein [Pseudomonas schmalbachii]
MAIAGHAYALGLGEVTVHSALNQPLDADIELLQVGNLGADELIARLASEAAFRQAGVERFMSLQDLRFTPVIRGGRSYIKVRSTQPVREPYMSFLLEVERPNGRLMREYTVLLDPPGYAPRGVSSATERYVAAPAAQPSVRRQAAPRQAAVARKPIAAGEGRYTTVRNDTLWSIASRLGARGTAHAQLMDGIHQLNPQAFINGDPHRLKAGQTLTLPASAEAPVKPAQPAVAATQPASRVEAAAPAAPTVPTAPAAPVTAAAVSNANTELAELTDERSRLSSRLDSMEQQLGSMLKSLEDRDRQIQQLQAELQRRQENDAKAQAAPAAAAPAPAQQAPAAAPAATASAATEDSSWRWMMVGGLFALLGGLLLARRRKSEKPDDTPVEAELPASEFDEEDLYDALEVVQPTRRAKAAAPAASGAAVLKLPTASTDGLEGANIYIAYGRYGHARDMLNESIARHPARMDMRLKLMTVLAELGDVRGFQEQAQVLLGLGVDPKEIEQIRAHYPAMAQAVVEAEKPAEPLGDADWDEIELEGPAPTVASESVAGARNGPNEIAWDLDWDSLENPLDNPLCSKKKQVELNDDLTDEFSSNLFELPEVVEEFDLDAEQQAKVFGGQDVLLEDGDFVRDLEEVSAHHDELLASLDRARACIDSGNLDEAYRILKQVIEDGDTEEKAEARELLAKIA